MDITVTNKKVELKPVLTGEDIIAMRSAIRDIPMADAVAEFALKLVVATHPEVAGASDYVKKYVSCGASPRAAQAIYQTARAKALLENRFNVSFDDIKSVAYPALRHRLVLSFEALADGVSADEIIGQIIDSVKVN
jgi:MoxR-like ATPase